MWSLICKRKYLTIILLSIQFWCSSKLIAVFALVISSNRDASNNSYNNFSNNKRLPIAVSDQDGTFFVLGLGRVGWRVAMYAIQNKLFLNAMGTVRDLNGHKFGLGHDRIRQLLFNEANLLSIAKKCRYVLITIPPPNYDNDDGDKHSNGSSEFFESALDEFVQHLQHDCWIGIISTTGVYGDHNGRWVSEESKCMATTAGSNAVKYLEYERKWETLSSKHTVVVFRCAGIYGNDQSALHTVYRAGRPVLGTDRELKSTTSSITNRIHVDDIAQAVVASIKQHKNRSTNVKEEETRTSICYRIYNLADNLPENRDVVLNYAADLLENAFGIPIPFSTQNATFAPSQRKSARERRRGMDRKRISNKRMRAELLQDSGFIFPTYREGLKSILKDRNNPWWCDTV
jgi:nucleoside-diphosphate-sugar epimerase